ncbi:MAG: sugar phosphate isomerase/epimerase family protein [Planctomycetota bacterium]
MLRLGYNTNGLAHHRPLDALRLLAELGYEGVALTPDVGLLDPFGLRPGEVAELRAAADDLGLALAIETGARFVLDARRKHFPTLLEDAPADRARRVDFLSRCVDLAAELGAETVSFWAGCAPGGQVGDAAEGGADEELWERLCEGAARVLTHARGTGVRLGFEPEPGMFLERPAGYRELCGRLGAAGDALGLCLDVGHLLCTGDLPVGDVIRAHAAELVMVHLDDIRGGVHEHRMFGEGELDLAETLGALLEVGYPGLAAVELSRDSHRGAAAAEEALGHLRTALGGLPG